MNNHKMLDPRGFISLYDSDCEQKKKKKPFFQMSKNIIYKSKAL